MAGGGWRKVLGTVARTRFAQQAAAVLVILALLLVFRRR